MVGSSIVGGLPLNHGVESVVMVSGVFDRSHRTVRFHKGVRSMDRVTVPGLVLRVNITSVRVMYCIPVVVVRVMIRVMFLVVGGGGSVVYGVGECYTQAGQGEQ